MRSLAHTIWLAALCTALLLSGTSRAHPVPDENTGEAKVGSPALSIAAKPLGYSAVYEARVSGARAEAQMTLTPYALKANGSQEYLFKSTVKAKGLARLFRSKPFIECSRFEITAEDQWLVKEYSFVDGDEDGKKTSRVDFNQQTGVATAEYKDDITNIEFQSDVTDRLMEQLLAARELRAGKIPTQFDVIERDNLYTVVYEFIGEERIKTRAGEFMTQKYERRREDSTRATLIWFAASQDYVPVRVEQYRDDDRQGTLELAALERVDVNQARGTVTPVCP